MSEVESADRHRVAVLAYGGMTGFEMGIATEIFGLAELSELFWPGIEQPWYDLRLCTETRGSVKIVGGGNLRTPYGLEELASADTVIIPSVADVRESVSPRLLEAVRHAADQGARMVSFCSGAFVFAAAGLLDGKRATTHWRYTTMLQERYPAIDVDPRPLYIDEGSVLTSAGCSAGLDLSLHLVRCDYGTQVANIVARSLVAAPHRSGGQAQYVESPLPSPAGDTTIVDSMNWALARIDQPISLDELADEAMLSRRSYLRQFTKATGTTPIKWLIARRIEASLELLETTDVPIERLAGMVGFASVITFRHHFTRIMATTPSEYRSTFAAA